MQNSYITNGGCNFFACWMKTILQKNKQEGNQLRDREEKGECLESLKCWNIISSRTYVFDIFLEIIGDEKLFETVIGIALRETRFALLLGPFMPKSLASSWF